jgi:hypothetical protein
MTPPPELPLDEQRRALRDKMRVQRQLIADQLGPGQEANGGYPRSRTMRFLTRRPGMTVAILAELAALLVGARYAKSMNTILAIARIARSAASARTGGASSKRAPDQRPASD